jgi:tetratricopeptide (TPR) repeat protein
LREPVPSNSVSKYWIGERLGDRWCLPPVYSTAVKIIFVWSDGLRKLGDLLGDNSAMSRGGKDSPKPRRALAAGLAAIALSALILIGPVQAASPAVHPGTAGESRAALFQQMMADPSNVDIALRYAQLSVADGDIEAAVSTLERLTIFAPHLSRLKFELGRLYFRLGAYEAASAYFQQARAAPDVTPQMQASIDSYLAAADKQSASDRLAGAVIFGARYQSNANGGAGSPWVDLNGVQFLLSPTARADADANGFVSASVHYSHDLASQGDSFDIDLATYASLYRKHDELNALAAELKFGPVFDLGRFSMSGASLGVYGIAGGELLKADPYFYEAGFGTVLTDKFDGLTQGKLGLEYRYEQYENSALRPQVSNMTGSRMRLSGELRRQIDPAVVLYARAYGERKHAAVGFESDWEAGGVLGGTVSFASPITASPSPWSLDLQLGLLTRDFDVANPMISATPESDQELSVLGTLNVPVSTNWSVLASVGYRRVYSNYDIDAFDDLSGVLAMMSRF